MIDYKTYVKLNEAFGGSFGLGVKSPQNLGIGAAPPGLGAGGPPNPDADSDEDELGDKDELGDEEGDEEGDEDELGDKDELGDEEGDEDELGDKDELGDEEGDEDIDLDHEDDLGVPEDNPVKAGPPKGKNPVTPFMKYMKSEGCEEDEKGEGPTFMMKKSKKCSDGDMMMNKKKCGDGDMRKGEKVILGKSKKMADGEKKCTCGKCSKCMAMKKEASQYARPKGYDSSDEAFYRSVREQLGASNVNQKWSSGLEGLRKEDILLPPPENKEPGPGEAGYAPQTRIGGDLTAESIQDIMKRLDRLEKK